MLGWLKRNNSAIVGLDGTQFNYVDPSNPSSQRTLAVPWRMTRRMHSLKRTSLSTPPPPPPPTQA